MHSKERQIEACHKVDREATEAMKALGRMMEAAVVDLALMAELIAARDALNAHGAAWAKYNALTGKVPN